MANGNDKSSLGKINDDFIAFDYSDQHKPIKKRDRYVSKRKIKDIIASNPPQSSIRPSEAESREEIHSSEYSNRPPDWELDNPEIQDSKYRPTEESDKKARQTMQPKPGQKMHHSLKRTLSKQNK